MGWSQQSVADEIKTFTDFADSGKIGKSARNLANHETEFELACHTQQEIADAVGWSREAVTKEIASFGNFGDSAKITKSAQNLANHETDFELACHTQQEIADAVGWSVQSVNNEIATFSSFADSGKIGKSAQNLANHETEFELACHTQQEIADVVGWSRQAVTDEIGTFAGFRDSPKIGKSARNLANHETE